MGNTTQHRKRAVMLESLHALQGNRHFDDFLEAMDFECGYGKTVYDAEPCQSSFNQGRQSFANDVHKHLATLKKESQSNETK